MAESSEATRPRYFQPQTFQGHPFVGGTLSGSNVNVEEGVVEHKLWPELPAIVAVTAAPGTTGICRHHLRGLCTFGLACKFLHPSMLPPPLQRIESPTSMQTPAQLGKISRQPGKKQLTSMQPASTAYLPQHGSVEQGMHPVALSSVESGQHTDFDDETGLPKEEFYQGFVLATNSQFSTPSPSCARGRVARRSAKSGESVPEVLSRPSSHSSHRSSSVPSATKKEKKTTKCRMEKR